MNQNNDEELIAARAEIARCETTRGRLIDRIDQRDVEIARLRNALQATIDGIAWDWQGHFVGNLPDVRDAAIKALEASQ